jgi:16S rRNA C967 or C1407 C5-methylase (RsmB/RsmF family)
MADDLRPWREQALDSDLLKAMAYWSKNPNLWLEAAIPRLSETIRINPLRREIKWTEDKIIEMGAKKIEWCPNGWIMPWKRGGIPPEYRSLFISLHETGRITRQEAVSMIPSLLLDLEHNDLVLDMCASPGSKSTHIGEILGGTGAVIANDISKKRTNTLVANAQRASLPNILIVQHDGRHIPKVPGQGYDAILVDAPCTGSATTRKNPDVWSKWKPSGGKKLHSLQLDLLSRAIKVARPGASIVYSTCSLDPTENEAVIARILEFEKEIEIEKINEDTLEGLHFQNGMTEWTVLDDNLIPTNEEKYSTSKNSKIKQLLSRCIRIHQDESGHGGFFVAKLRVTKKLNKSTNKEIRRISLNPKRKGTFPIPIGNQDFLRINEIHAPSIEDACLWSKGKRILWSHNSIKQKIWSLETQSKSDRIHDGEQWPPLNLIHLGIRAWESRDSRDFRLSSEGLHSIKISNKGKRIHNVDYDTARKIIGNEEPIENNKKFTTGGHLLLLERDGVQWRIPIWVGERISRMWKQQEDVILRKMMGLDE